jgi:hypothetical protein
VVIRGFSKRDLMPYDAALKPLARWKNRAILLCDCFGALPEAEPAVTQWVTT